MNDEPGVEIDHPIPEGTRIRFESGQTEYMGTIVDEDESMFDQRHTWYTVETPSMDWRIKKSAVKEVLD